MAQAAQGYLSRSVARVSPKTNTLIRAIVISFLIYAFLALLNFTTLIDSDMCLTLCTLLLEFVALLVLRLKFPNMKCPYKILGGLWGAIRVCISPTFLTLWLLQNTFMIKPLSFWLEVGLSGSAAIS
ncbi:MAG: hypothetical protein D4R85_01000 [Streptomycetaceae bacterium]|jgi:amino acid transporter|nr:MAG: hypothetical protein D4R85_01000 [Streptomycetaceae bacterium]